MDAQLAGVVLVACGSVYKRLFGVLRGCNDGMRAVVDLNTI